jgi:hypothetical protein
MMRRLIVLDLFSGPAWRDASYMVGHVPPGADGAWLMIETGSVQVVDEHADGGQVLLDADQGGPSFYCRTWHTTAGRDRPTVHTVAAGNADLHEEVLTQIGFRLEEPDGIQLQRDDSGIYWGYYI